MPINNNELTEQVSSPAEDMAKLMAAQSAAMLVEDMRAFLQGSEQILMVALAKVLAKATGSAPGEAREDSHTASTVTSITGAIKSLSDYAERISHSAGTIVGGFSGVETLPAKEAPETEQPGEINNLAANNLSASGNPPGKSKGFFASLIS